MSARPHDGPDPPGRRAAPRIHRGRRFYVRLVVAVVAIAIVLGILLTVPLVTTVSTIAPSSPCAPGSVAAYCYAQVRVSAVWNSRVTVTWTNDSAGPSLVLVICRYPGGPTYAGASSAGRVTLTFTSPGGTATCQSPDIANSTVTLTVVSPIL